MRFTYDEYTRITKTKLEMSSVVNGLFISRSAIGVQVNDKPNLFFGFGTGFTRDKSAASSLYELLEHMVFLPFFHTLESMDMLPVFASQGINLPNPTIKLFFIGADGPLGCFTANGCAISRSPGKAMEHSKNELLERHTCSQIWYHRNKPLLAINDFDIKLTSDDLTLSFYTTDTLDEDRKFGLVSLDCSSSGFFALGAGIRDTIDDALTHAASEAIMIFEDAKKGRKGLNSMRISQQGILSLRNKELSYRRKEYLNFIKNNPPKNILRQKFSCDYVCFEPLPGVFAARSFSRDALDPKILIAETTIPTLPLY